MHYHADQSFLRFAQKRVDFCRETTEHRCWVMYPDFLGAEPLQRKMEQGSRTQRLQVHISSENYQINPNP